MPFSSCETSGKVNEPKENLTCRKTGFRWRLSHARTTGAFGVSTEPGGEASREEKSSRKPLGTTARKLAHASFIIYANKIDDDDKYNYCCSFQLRKRTRKKKFAFTLKLIVNISHYFHRHKCEFRKNRCIVGTM